MFDLGGFRAWATSGEAPEHLRATFVAGEVLLEMSPESTESHNKAKVEVTEVLSRLVDEHDLGELYGDGVLLTHEAAELSTEPDAVFVSWAALRSGRVTFVAKAGRSEDAVELVGSPDLVVEVIRDGSVRKDTKLLREAYARAGIPEYWLLDARGASLSFVILTLAPNGEYGLEAPDGEPQPSHALGRRFSLRREKNAAGRWRYALDVLG